MVESWRKVWRDGVEPLLSNEALKELRKALINDDARLIQGVTTEPQAMPCVQNSPVEAACAISYCGWQGDELDTVGEVDEFFAKMCFEIDNRLGEHGAHRWFINWFDDTPRKEMRRELLKEINRSLEARMVTAGEVLS